MIRQFKIILFAVCGCILSQGCNNDQRSDKLTLDKKKQLIEYMRTKYNDMGIIIEISNYDSVTYETVYRMDTLLSGIREYNEQQKKKKAK
jgi:hypothetical protein